MASELTLDIDPRSGYGFVDVVRLFMLVGERPLGRSVLVRKLKLGEASVRTMLKTLKEKKLLEQDTRGVGPAKKARERFCFLDRIHLVDVAVPEFSENPSAAVLVKDAAGAVRSGVEERDEGVRFGASVLTFVMKGCRLKLAGVPEHTPPYSKGLRDEMGAKSGDVVIISTAGSKLDAERAVIAASLRLVSD